MTSQGTATPTSLCGTDRTGQMEITLFLICGLLVSDLKLSCYEQNNIPVFDSEMNSVPVVYKNLQEDSKP